MKRLLMSVLTGVVVLVTGCTTAQPAANTEPGSGETAVMCSKCQTVWVSRSRGHGKGQTYRHKKKMDCPDCDSAVEYYFKTGKLEHTCKTCAGNLAACPVCN